MIVLGFFDDFLMRSDLLSRFQQAKIDLSM